MSVSLNTALLYLIALMLWMLWFTYERMPEKVQRIKSQLPTELLFTHALHSWRCALGTDNTRVVPQSSTSDMVQKTCSGKF